MRTAPNNNGSNLKHGTAWQTKQYINIDLTWLALPTVVWLMSTCVLFITLWETKNTDVPSWKSSSIVLLQCMLTDNGLGRSKKVGKQSADRHGQLQQNGNGWQLVDTGFDVAGNSSTHSKDNHAGKTGSVHSSVTTPDSRSSLAIMPTSVESGQG
jgi:hypothetical protein